jgi:hypothetical protein
MFALDAYRPDQWHDFFVMVGGGAVVLTGLVFVALSLNVNVVTQDATHRYRAIDTLTAMTGIFVICAFALMGGQDHRAVGIEWLVVAAISIAVYYTGTSRPSVAVEAWPGSADGDWSLPLCSTSPNWSAQRCSSPTTSPACMLPRVAMIAALTLMISGAWLLVVGVTMREPKTLDRSP